MEICEKCGSEDYLINTEEIINIPNDKGQIRYVKTITHHYCGKCRSKFISEHKHHPNIWKY